MIQELKTPPLSLQEKGENLLSLAFDQSKDFLWDEKRMEALEKLSYKEVAEISASFLSSQNPSRVSVIYAGKIAKPSL
jgi:secreted Zn-dependent insulinase-like peptidase